MFRRLVNFSYQRTALQAVGWYLIFSFMGVLFGLVGAMILAMGIASFARGLTDVGLQRLGYLAGEFTIIPYHIVLAVALLWRRSKAALNIFLALLAVLLSAFLGPPAFLRPLAGLIPLTVLTTRPIQKSPAEVGEVFK